MVVLATPDRRETSSTLTPPSPDFVSSSYVMASTAFLDFSTRSSVSRTDLRLARNFFTGLPFYIRYGIVALLWHSVGWLDAYTTHGSKVAQGQRSASARFDRGEQEHR